MRDRNGVTKGRSRLCWASKFLPLAVEEFALAQQDGDRSERGAMNSPTLNLAKQMV